ncbi:MULTISPECIES: hypothetical protein [Caproicibacterium]|uniref:Uncharacterized protein n=1 Tax=Caproicibacterium lactatifermentans TaxID=2666138 RepID=A0A859DMQ7_9FIRM|nr:hypothetical protein [Caproicibacterium lactatifermentans]MDD4806931.1 hypothetical protein [Oscillospiraceae bacterium]QKN23030.1 hypothetical protein GJQ69_00155 [Caproicibacterium lactatifermentans]QKO30364.1 hypothetical protein GKP14_04625 [Caproicibacterium lactatifermentans]
MKTADLRRTLLSCNDRLLEIGGEHLYYTRETNAPGCHRLSLLVYSQAAKSSRTLASYLIMKPEYRMHSFAFPDSVLVVMENGDSEAWILKLNKHTGAEEQLSRVRFAGNFAGCCALDADHVVLYSHASRRDASLFLEYRRHTGFGQAASLYDLQKDCCWSIRDPRICAGAQLIPFDGGGERRLLAVKAWGTEKEKQKAFLEREWVSAPVEDRVWLCTLQQFLSSIEAECPEVPMTCTLRAGIDGMVRCAGQDRDSLYFRAQYFPTQDQQLLAISKHTGAKRRAASLNLSPSEKDASFLAENGHFFKLSDLPDGRTHVQGILNSTLDTVYSRSLGQLAACLDDRWLLLRDILCDGKDSLLFYHLLDTQTGHTTELEGRCAVRNNTLVLF